MLHIRVRKNFRNKIKVSDGDIFEETNFTGIDFKKLYPGVKNLTFIKCNLRNSKPPPGSKQAGCKTLNQDIDESTSPPTITNKGKIKIKTLTDSEVIELLKPFKEERMKRGRLSYHGNN